MGRNTQQYLYHDITSRLHQKVVIYKKDNINDSLTFKQIKYKQLSITFILCASQIKLQFELVKNIDTTQYRNTTQFY